MPDDAEVLEDTDHPLHPINRAEPVADDPEDAARDAVTVAQLLAEADADPGADPYHAELADLPEETP
jgi:hypothetical protein